MLEYFPNWYEIYFRGSMSSLLSTQSGFSQLSLNSSTHSGAGSSLPSRWLAGDQESSASPSQPSRWPWRWSCFFVHSRSSLIKKRTRSPHAISCRTVSVNSMRLIASGFPTFCLGKPYVQQKHLGIEFLYSSVKSTFIYHSLTCRWREEGFFHLIIAVTKRVQDSLWTLSCDNSLDSAFCRMADWGLWFHSPKVLVPVSGLLRSTRNLEHCILDLF